MTREVRVVHEDGTEVQLGHIAHQIENTLGKVRTATATVPRSEVDDKDVTFERNTDDIFIETERGRRFGGKLRDIDPGTETVNLQVDSFERAAIMAEPSSGGVRWDNVDDSVVVNDAIDSVDELTAGTVETVKSGLSFLFAHTSPAKRIRQVVDAAGFVTYGDDKTVDYTGSIGTDHDIDVSPSNETAVESFRVTELGGKEQPTHLRMLGSGEGRHQVVANVVPDADTDTYENKVTYASDWEMGDTEIWRVLSNKDIQKPTTLQEHGKELIAELSTEHIEVQSALVQISPPGLGDTYPVSNARKGIDQRLTVVELTERLDADGERWEVALSSRELPTETADSKARQDTERYNKAVQGTAVPINASGGRQPVNSNHNYRMKLYYPAEVEYEHRLNVRVIGLAYRAYSSGAASGGDHTHEISDTTSSNTEPGRLQNTGLASGTHSGSDNWSTLDTFTPSNPTSYVLCYMTFNFNDDDTTETYEARVDAGVPEFPDSGGLPASVVNTSAESAQIYTIIVPGDWNGTTLDAQIKVNGSMTWGIIWNSVDVHTHDLATTSTASGPHTHDPEPGIIEDFSGTVHYPGSCDVLVNGNSQGTSFGDGTGEFEERVDIQGALNAGQVNTIEVTSGSLGHIMAYVEGDVYRQILGDG